MIDDELVAFAEEVGERHLSARPFEDMLLLHLLPGQFAALAAQLIAPADSFDLLRLSSWHTNRSFGVRRLVGAFPRRDSSRRITYR